MKLWELISIVKDNWVNEEHDGFGFSRGIFQIDKRRYLSFNVANSGERLEIAFVKNGELQQVPKAFEEYTSDWELLTLFDDEEGEVVQLIAEKLCRGYFNRY